MGLLKVIDWEDSSHNTIVHKVDLKKDYITKGSKLTVRDSQVCIFADKGQFADVFGPGFYNLDTDNVPILTKLMSWKYGFESPFKSDIYFVNTKQFPNNKWGTMNPIMIRDKDFGAVRVRGYGAYSFKVEDPVVFLRELSGTGSSYKTQDIIDWIKSILITSVTDAVGESKIPVLDMAGNLVELGKMVQDAVQEDLNEIGIKLTKFNFENFSLPPELEKKLDEQTGLGMMRQNMDVYTQVAQLEALKTAAGNPGMAGSMMGAGIGLGMGANMAQTFNNMTQPMAQNSQPQQAAPKPAEDTCACKNCGAQVKKTAKFCPECGKPTQTLCPECGNPVQEGAKFCPECGHSFKVVCPSCKAELKPGQKFCPECGTKI